MTRRQHIPFNVHRDFARYLEGEAGVEIDSQIHRCRQVSARIQHIRNAIGIQIEGGVPVEPIEGGGRVVVFQGANDKLFDDSEIQFRVSCRGTNGHLA